MLLDEAFDVDFTDDDFEHALGDMLAMVWEGLALVGHGSVVMRRRLLAGRALHIGMSSFVDICVSAAGLRHAGHGCRVSPGRGI